MKFLTVFGALCLAFFLAGCASSGVRVTEEQIAGFKKGVTTEGDVIQKLGQPNIMQTSPAGKKFVYSYAHVQMRPATFIPIVGIFAGGSDVKSSAAVFTFDTSGKLLAQHISSSQFGTGTGFAAGTPMEQTDQPRQ